MSPITNHKTVCAAFNFDGFRYSGYWSGFYHYVKALGASRHTYLHMRLLEQDLTEKNARCMIKIGASR